MRTAVSDLSLHSLTVIVPSGKAAMVADGESIRPVAELVACARPHPAWRPAVIDGGQDTKAQTSRTRSHRYHHPPCSGMCCASVSQHCAWRVRLSVAPDNRAALACSPRGSMQSRKQAEALHSRAECRRHGLTHQRVQAPRGRAGALSVWPRDRRHVGGVGEWPQLKHDRRAMPTGSSGWMC
jgi:hypothetical protein